jgi:hypothetical protein
MAELTPERLQEIRALRRDGVIKGNLSGFEGDIDRARELAKCTNALTDLLAALDAANARIAALEPDAALGYAVRSLAVGFGIRREGRDTWARTFNDAPAGVEATPDAALGLVEKGVKG